MKKTLKPEDLPSPEMLMEEYKNLIAAAEYLEESAEFYRSRGNIAMADGMETAAAERRRSAARLKEQISSSSTRKKTKKKQKKQKLNKAAAAFLTQLEKGGKQK